MSIKIAYIVQKYYHPGQTFVNRHIANLFSGNACIVSERAYNAVPEGAEKPWFVLRKNKRNLRDLVVYPFETWRSWNVHHSMRVPYGIHRARLKEFLETEKVDIILSEFGSQAMVISDLGKEMGLPVFCYFRGRDASYWLNNDKRLQAYRNVFENLAGVFTVSQFLLDNLKSVGLDHPNAHVIPSGTDVDLFRPGDKDPNLFVSVGRFVPKKAPDITIRAFLKATENYQKARLEMFGSGPLLKKSIKLAHDLGGAERIIFHGRQDTKTIAACSAQASVFLLHSVYDRLGEAEGLPSAIQEAMAAGMAIISTNHAGIPELVIPNENGFLVDEYDEEAFTKAISACLADSTHVQKMGKNARKLALERVDYRKLYVKAESVMRAALEGKK